MVTPLSSPPQSLDLHKPIDKRIYKGTQPTCHDFNQFTATADTIGLLVGFSAGQVQYLDLVKKDTSKLFNEEVSPARVGERGHKGRHPPPAHPHPRLRSFCCHHTYGQARGDAGRAEVPSRSTPPPSQEMVALPGWRSLGASFVRGLQWPHCRRESEAVP